MFINIYFKTAHYQKYLFILIPIILQKKTKKSGILNMIKVSLLENILKQTWLANQLCKINDLVNGYVKNRKQPRLEVLFEIAQILHVDVKKLIISNSLKSK